MAPPGRVRARVRPQAFREEAMEESMTLSTIPTNSFFVGDGIARCATRWLAVAAVLRRPNGNTVEVLHAEHSRERVRQHGSSLDGWGPRETSGWHSSLP